MRITSISLLLSIFCLTINTVNAQQKSIKRSWEIGIQGSPIFGINSSNNENRFKGGFVSASINYFLFEKLSVGLMPFYGAVKNRSSIGIDINTGENWGIREQKYNSFGANINVKYFPLGLKKWSPFIQMIAGLGDTYLDQYQINRYGQTDYDEILKYTTTNLGIGVGVSLKITKAIIIDASIMYSKISTTTTPAPMHFAFPSVGISKLLK